MALVSLEIQGSDGTTRNVLLDSVTGQVYDIPIYKLAVGAAGAATLVSAANPLPVTAAQLPLPADAATETTLSKLYTKIPAGLATENTLSALNTKIPADPARETTLSALNAKITTDAANTARTTATIVLPVQIVDSAGRSPKTDSTTKAMMIIDYFHHEIHSGSFFFVKSWADVDGAGTNLDFLWVVPDSDDLPHAQWNIAGEAEFTLYLYEDVTTSANGSAVTIFNANRNSLNTAGVAAYSGPTLAGGALGDGNQGGTLIWSGKIGSGKTATIGRGTNYEIPAMRDTKYWFRINKEAAGTHWLDYDFNWYEHADG